LVIFGADVFHLGKRNNSLINDDFFNFVTHFHIATFAIVS